MIALYILLGLILLIFLLLLVPVRFEFRYGETCGAAVRYLFFTFDLWSADEIKDRTEEAAEDTGKKSLNLFDKLRREKGFAGAVSEMNDIIRAAAEKLFPLLRRVVVDRFSLDISVGGEDAALTALAYGTVCGIVYPLRGFLAGIFRFRENQVNIRADFGSPDSHVNLFTKLHFIPVLAVPAGAALGLRMLFYHWKNRTSNKQVKDGVSYE